MPSSNGKEDNKFLSPRAVRWPCSFGLAKNDDLVIGRLSSGSGTCFGHVPSTLQRHTPANIRTADEKMIKMATR